MNKKDEQAKVGGGMSFNCKLEMIRNLEQQKSEDRKTIILDPQNEYKNINNSDKNDFKVD